MFTSDLPVISKAIAGGIVTALVALLAKYGFQATPDAINAGGVLGTIIVGYLLGHVVVFFSPANKPKA